MARLLVDCSRWLHAATHGTNDALQVLDASDAVWERTTEWLQAHRHDTDRRLHLTVILGRVSDLALWRMRYRAWVEARPESERSAWSQSFEMLQPGYQSVHSHCGRLRLTLIEGEWPILARRMQLQCHVAFAPNQAALKEAGGWKSLTRLLSPGAAVYADIGPEPDEARKLGLVRDAEAWRYQPRATQTPQSVASHRREAIVIGAGLAGCATAQRLAARGYHVTVFDSEDGIARRGSGNPAGMFMPLLAQDDNPMARWTRAAFLFALQAWHHLGGIGRTIEGAQCGVLQPIRSHILYEHHRIHSENRRYPFAYAQLLDPPTASAQAGTRLAYGAWCYPRAGWLRPASLCARLIEQGSPHIKLHLGTRVESLVWRDGCWTALTAQGEVLAQAPTVVLASGCQVPRLSPALALPLQAIRGQITALPKDCIALDKVLCGEAYVIPATDPTHWVGASYEPICDDALRLDSQLDNMRRLQAMLPDMQLNLDTLPLSGRVGYRAVAVDRLPLVGAVPDGAAVGERHIERSRDLPRLPGLYSVLGLASRGITWSALAAECVAADIAGDGVPLPQDLREAIDPGRFLLRKARQSV